MGKEGLIGKLKKGWGTEPVRGNEWSGARDLHPTVKRRKTAVLAFRKKNVEEHKSAQFTVRDGEKEGLPW